MNEEIDSCVKFKRNSWHRRLHDIVYGKHSLQRMDYAKTVTDRRLKGIDKL